MDMAGGEGVEADQRLADLNEYLSKGIHTVKGWCVPHLWQTLWPLYCEIGDGPVAEIGVFEGKFFVGLCKTFGVGVNIPAAAIDVFDMQQFNLDGAGVGKVDILRRNLDTHGVNQNAVSFIKADSLALTQRDSVSIVNEMGHFHFFSVDGCHEVIHTAHDIEFAMSVTANHGIIAVDDYTNPDWPGVQEAVSRMYLMRDFNFVPLAVTCNKLLLCSYSYHAARLLAIERYISANYPTTRIKRVKRFGFQTLTVQPQHAVWNDIVN